MRMVVTGGAGFIGSNLVDRLLAAGDQVTVIDDFSRGRSENLPPLGGQQLQLIAMDLRDPGLPAVLAGSSAEVIFHLAAQIDVRASVANPVQDANINVIGTIALAEAARLAGVRKIVFASSGGAIYGSNAPIPTPESTAPQPLSPYGAAKLAGEVYLDSFSRLHSLSCTHLAFANVYGPRQDPLGEAGVVAVFSTAMLLGQRTRIFGDGANTRDYVHVADVVSALVAAARDVADRQRFNIGTGVQTTDRELHTLIADAVGCPDRPEFAAERRGDLRNSALDPSLAGQVLGWQPTYDLPSGISDTVKYFAAQMNSSPRFIDRGRSSRKTR